MVDEFTFKMTMPNHEVQLDNEECDFNCNYACLFWKYALIEIESTVPHKVWISTLPYIATIEKLGGLLKGGVLSYLIKGCS